MLDEPTSEVPVIRRADLTDRDASDRGADRDTTDRDATDQSTTDQDTTDQDATDQSTTDQDTTDQDATDRSTTDQNATHEDAADQDARFGAGPGIEDLSAADTPDETDSGDAAAAHHLDDPGAEPTLLLRPAPADRAHHDYDNNRDDHDHPTAAGAAAATENETENQVQIPDATHILGAPPQPAATPPVTAPFGAPSRRFGETATSGQTTGGQTAGAETAGAETAGAEATAEEATADRDSWGADNRDADGDPDDRDADNSDAGTGVAHADADDRAGNTDDAADAGGAGDVGPPQTVTRSGSRAPGDVAENPIAVWSDESADRLREQWRELQGQFIDDPVEAVSAAKALVTEAVQELANTLLEAQDELDPFRAGEAVDTEAMRVAMRRYREFLDRVLAL
jgi:hypothetical protein